MVLIMTVNPDLGQSFIEEMLEKIHYLRNLYQNEIDIQVDGINNETGMLVGETGANVIVSGSCI